MVTFSINTNTPNQAIAYPLPQYFTTILYTLQDNDTKMISPGDLRDAVSSLYSYVPFKKTTASGSSTFYIGTDWINPNDRSQNNDLKKLFFGKRAFSGTYSYSSSHDIMNLSLLTSDTDIFFYNTKDDLFDQDTTKMLIMSGVNTSNLNNSPYIQSQRVTGFSSVTSTSGSDGLLNQSFNTNLGGGFDAEVWSVKVQSDNKILVGGQFMALNGNPRFFLVRLNSDGTEDTSFYTNLGGGFDNTIFSIQLQSDGKILVGGDFGSLNGNPRDRLVRLNSDGTEDSTFVSNFNNLGGFDSTVLSIQVQSDGKILVGGAFTTLHGNTRNYLVRLNSDGTEDTAFYTNLGSGFDSSVNSIQVQLNGRILVGGSFTNLNLNFRNRLVRLNSNGTEDTAFYTNLGSGFNQAVYSIQIQSDGRILVGGRFTNLNGNTRFRLVRLNTIGSEDTSFYTNLGSGFSGIVASVKLQSDGKILVGGTFLQLNGNTRNYLVRLNSDGIEDTTFYTNLGGGFDNDVNSIDLQNSLGRIYVGGYFITLGTFSTSTFVNLSSPSLVVTPSLSNDSLSLDFVNTIGDINVRSDWGTVSINTVKWPSIIESGLSASSGRILRYLGNSSLYWDNTIYPLLTFLGTTGSTLNMFGNPFNINGYPFQFSDTRRITSGLNDLKMGNVLTNIPLTEMLRRLIYPTLKPTCSIEILPPYAGGYTEVGTFPNPVIQFTINKKTYPTLITGLTNMIPGIYPPITNPEYATVTSTSNGIVISPITATATTFTITVNDGIVGSSVASTSLSGIYPYFYGFSGLSSMTTIGLSSLTKIVEPKSDKTFDVTGSGNLFFIYPKDYGTLSSIVDNGGFTASGSFSTTIQVFSSPTGLWAAEEFYVYKWTNATTVGLPSVNYELKY